MAKSGSSSMFAGTDALPDVNLEIGMNFDMWKRDRTGFRTSVQMVTGGQGAAFGDYAGSEVGENYPGAMGEDRASNVTYVSSNAMENVPEKPGSMAKGGDSAVNEPGTTGRGKSTLRAPQNYTRP